MQFCETFKCRLCGREFPLSQLAPPFWDPKVEKPICLRCFEKRPELEFVRRVKRVLQECLQRVKERKQGGDGHELH